MFERIKEIIENIDDFREVIESYQDGYDGRAKREFLETMSKHGIKVKFETASSTLCPDDRTDYMVVLKFIDGNGRCMIRWDYYYQSYYGSEIEDFYEVTKEETVVYKYTNIKDKEWLWKN